jgi:hypothetical protein
MSGEPLVFCNFWKEKALKTVLIFSNVNRKIDLFCLFKKEYRKTYFSDHVC